MLRYVYYIHMYELSKTLPESLPLLLCFYQFPPEFLRILALFFFFFFSSLLVTQTVKNLPAKQETWV